MYVVCPHCNNYVSETAQVCPNCGAPNPQFFRVAKDTPQTIAELKKWYEDNQLPPEEVTRFFIGKNTDEPRAFGIYQDGEDFIVYKNKSDGVRAIRYQGRDEAYAVNELYLRLKEEILSQKERRVEVRKNPTREEVREKIQPPEVRSPEVQLPKLKLKWRDVIPYAKNIVIFLILASIIVGIGFGIGAGVKRLRGQPKIGYYYLEDEDLYYNYGWSDDPLGDDECGYEWWIYNEDSNDWELYSYEAESKDFPAPLSKQSERSRSLPFKGHAEYTDEKYNIETSHGYIDVHPPSHSSQQEHSQESSQHNDDNSNDHDWPNSNSGGSSGWSSGWGYSYWDDDNSSSSSSSDWGSSSYDHGSDWDSGGSWDYGDSGWDSGSSNWDSGDSSWDSGSSDWGSDWGSGSDYSWDSGSSWDYGDSGWDSSSSDWGSDW